MKLKVYIYSLAAALLIIFGHYHFERRATVDDPYLGNPVTLALFVGIALAMTVKLSGEVKDSLSVFFKQILQLGIIFSGFKISLVFLQQVPAQMIYPLIATLVILFSLFFVFYKLKPESFGRFSLIYVGLVICGVSAILATSEIVKSNKEKTILATTLISLVGLASVFYAPALAHYLFESDVLKNSLYLGLVIPDTAQVIASSYQHLAHYKMEAVLSLALMAKLIRNLSLPIFLYLLNTFQNRYLQNESSGTAKIKILPGFILGFILAGLFRISVESFLYPHLFSNTGSWIQWVLGNFFKIADSVSLWFFTASGLAMGALLDWRNFARLLNWQILVFVVAAIVLINLTAYQMIRFVNF